jgi:hypothetical protein
MSLAEHCSPLTAPNTWKKTESTLRQIWGQQDKDKGQDSEVGGQWPMQCKWGAAQSVLCHQTKHFTNPLTNGCLLKHVLTALVDSGMSVPDCSPSILTCLSCITVNTVPKLQLATGSPNVQGEKNKQTPPISALRRAIRPDPPIVSLHWNRDGGCTIFKKFLLVRATFLLFARLLSWEPGLSCFRGSPSHWEPGLSRFRDAPLQRAAVCV